MKDFLDELDIEVQSIKPSQASTPATKQVEPPKKTEVKNKAPAKKQHPRSGSEKKPTSHRPAKQ